MERKIPIGFCPNCNHAVIYSSDPKEKRNVRIRVAGDGSGEHSFLCARCKTMLAVVAKPKVATGYVAVPIVNFMQCKRG